MIITLVDGGKDFQELELKEKGNSKTVHCQTGLSFTCISRYLICKDGRVYGRIATELQPRDLYNGTEYNVKDDSHLGKMLQYHIKQLQERA